MYFQVGRKVFQNPGLEAVPDGRLLNLPRPRVILFFKKTHILAKSPTREKKTMITVEPPTTSECVFSPEQVCVFILSVSMETCSRQQTAADVISSAEGPLGVGRGKK